MVYLYNATMDILQKHYAKWNKTDSRDYILHDSIYRKCPEKENLERQKVRLVVA